MLRFKYNRMVLPVGETSTDYMIVANRAEALEAINYFQYDSMLSPSKFRWIYWMDPAEMGTPVDIGEIRNKEF